MGKHGVICLSNNQKGTNALGWAHHVEKVASKQSFHSFSGTGGLPEHFEPNWRSVASSIRWPLNF